jgi:hypothetical protein
MDDRARTLFVRTLRAISIGEEILIDYAYSARMYLFLRLIIHVWPFP